MKKIKFKTRLQWGWFRSALFGTVIGLLIAPGVGELIGTTDEGGRVNTYSEIKTACSELFSGEKTKILIDGKVVAIARSEEAAKEAVKQARLAYNADGVKMLDLTIDYEVADKEERKGMQVLRGDDLKRTLQDCFAAYAEEDKQLAYTMRIDDYTVTLDRLDSLVSILEQTQSKYDEEDEYKVKLTPLASRNVTMYEVSIGSSQNDSENTSEDSQSDESDGIKYIGFSEDIQVVETYVKTNQITDKDVAYEELNAENDEESIYVVEPGDCLEIIAEKLDMTVEEIQELNPEIKSDENLYYDDRLNVTMPKAPVQVLVKKQETYEEKYHAEVEYEDDDEMYVDETEVIQKGKAGKHIVTDLVTYKGEQECEREQLEETVEVAAVPKIVRRGTKSRPTYIYPVTNWYVTSTFGYRWGALHAGIDVGVPVGTTVRASRAGQVVTAGWVGGYGNCVIIDHGDGVFTRYGHLSEFTVSAGDYVEQGEQIALSGNTGRSTGPHLHFEIRPGDEAVDPAPYLE